MKDSFTEPGKELVLQCQQTLVVFTRSNPQGYTAEKVDAVLSIAGKQTPTTRILDFPRGHFMHPAGHETEVRLYKNPATRLREKQEKEAAQNA